MNVSVAEHRTGTEPATLHVREQLLAGIPVRRRRLVIAGISTVLLEGGAGPPMVLLHGPGEFAEKWFRILPNLMETHRVIAPDLPAHGESGSGDVSLDATGVLAWLGELIARTCEVPPVVVGHVLGGAIATRFAIERPREIGRLVLVDPLGLAPFRPAPRFALAMVHFMARPNERTYDRFMRQCSHDLDALREQMGDRWAPFVAYNLDRARSPASKAVGRLMREVGLPRIPPGNLAGLALPVVLIWGRHDRANRLRIGQEASARYGWPLHVIEDCADDPARDQPEAFLDALRAALAPSPAPEVQP